MTQARAIMIARVNGAGFSGAQVQQQGNDNMVITVPGANTQKVVRLVGVTAQLLFRQVLLVGNNTSTSSPTTSPTPTPSSSGTPTVSPSPSTKASSSPKAAGAPGTAGQAGGHGLASSSRLLAASKPKPGKSSTPAASSTPSAPATTSPTPAPSAPAASPNGDPKLVHPAVLKVFNKLDCTKANWKQQIGYTTAIYDDPSRQIVACANPGVGFQPGTKFVLAPAKVLGKQVTSAQAGTASSQQSLSSKWQVNLSLNGAGATAFGNLTSQLVSKYYTGSTTTSVLDDVAIVLDGQIVSAPQIQQAITGGNAQITYFPRAEAQNLANELNYGALPVTFKQQNIESVSPELGRNQLAAGLIAAAIGLGLVVIYSFFYYRGLGIVSVSSLIVAGILAFLSVVLLSKYASSGFSLSLSGIAGLIVAIGITADSFVVYFERLRDEVREGKSLRPAVESGWKRARRTILARTRFFSSGHPMSGLDPARLGARTPWRSGVPRSAARRAREA
jgi:preprotein translocase subunit SecD